VPKPPRGRPQFEAQQREKTGRELDARLRKAETTIARLEGRHEALLEGARRDPGLI